MEANIPFQLQGPAGNLEGILHPVEGSRAYAVICHPHPLYGGTMDNKVVTTIASTLQKLGVNAVRFNYRGIGASEGAYGDISGEVSDAIAVSRWIQDQFDVDSMYFAGFSFGAFISAMAAKEMTQAIDVPHVLMVAPSVLHSPFEQALPLVAPATVIMGEEDEVVPFEEVSKWVEELAEVQFIPMPETSHFFHRKLLELRDHINTTYSPYILV